MTNEGMSAEEKRLRDFHLSMLIADLRPFAERPLGSIRIDMEDVRVILALYDELEAIKHKDTQP